MKILPYLIIGLFVFSQCSPKVSDDLGKTKEMPEEGRIAASMQDFRSGPPEPGPARPVEIGDYELIRLRNGIKMIVVEDHKLPRVSYQVFLDRKPVQEEEYAGLGSITGQMLNKGTATRTKAEIDEAVDFIGASLNTGSRGGFASSLTKHTDQLLEIFSDVILNPRFPSDEFDKIKKQTISGLQAEKNDPNAIANKVSSALTYGKDHPYGEIVTETTVENIDLEKCREYYNTYFRPNIAYIVVVGDITPREAREKIEKHFGGWEPAEVPIPKYDFPRAPSKTEVAFVDRAGAVQSVIDISYPLMLKPGAPDATPASVMNMVLGGGFSGRLNQNLREDKGYTYGSRSSLNTDELIGAFSASASVRNEVTDSAVTQFMYELEKITSEPVEDKELELAKNYMAGNFARSLESPQTVARFALNTERYNLPKDYYKTYLQRLDAVSKEDVLEMAKKYIRPENAHILIVGNQDEVADKLTRFDLADQKVTFYDIYANEKKPVAAAPSDITGKSIIKGYIDAIGGESTLSRVNSIRRIYGMEVMGQKMEMAIVQKAPNMLQMMMSAQGMTMMKQVFDGENGYIEQMGQKQMLEGEQLESMKEDAMLFPEMEYLASDYTIEVAGMEEVNGMECYKVMVENPDGKKWTEYYDRTSMMKVKEVKTESAQGQTVTVSNVFSDYREVEGIKFPHTLQVAGMMPMPMTMSVKEIDVNPELPQDHFKVH